MASFSIVMLFLVVGAIVSGTKFIREELDDRRANGLTWYGKPRKSPRL